MAAAPNPQARRARTAADPNREANQARTAADPTPQARQARTTADPNREVRQAQTKADPNPAGSAHRRPGTAGWGRSGWSGPSRGAAREMTAAGGDGALGVAAGGCGSLLGSGRAQSLGSGGVGASG